MSNNSFTPEDPELYSYKCDQTIIIQEKYLPLINPDLEQVEIPEPKDVKEWYPFVNSFYQFGEDFDASSRLRHLRYEKTPIQSSTSTICSTVSCPATKSFRECYTERNAVLNYLNSKPMCFFILGKPELGGHVLGSLLAEYWNSVCIHPQVLIEEEIASESRPGMCIEYNLRSGRAVSVDVILRLLEKRLQTKSVGHRGFVLCGFPLLANGLFSSDPVSSESAIFNVQEIFDEMVDTIFEEKPPESIKNVSLTSGAASIYSAPEPVVDVQSSVVGKDPEKMAVDVGTTNEAICYDSNVYKDYSDQMNLIFNLISDFEVILIYVKCENEEVVNLRKNNRVNARTMEYFNKNQEHRVNYFSSIFMEVDEQNFKMLKLQRDFPTHVLTQLEKYRFEAQPVIEKYILYHNPEYVIKLDGRLSPNQMFQALKTRLKILPISKSIIPELVSDLHSQEESGEGDSPRIQLKYENQTPEELFETFSKKKIVGPLFKWALSDFQYNCPIALHRNSPVGLKGSPKYAVHFLNKLYFLSNYNALVEFTRNPRPYLFSSLPKGTLKIYVIGPPLSGKTNVSLALSYLFGLPLISLKDVLQKYLHEHRDEIIAEAKQRGASVGLQKMKELRKSTYLESEERRLQQIEEFKNNVLQSIEAFISCSYIVGDFNEAEITSLPVPRLVEKPPVIIECEEKIIVLTKYFQNLNIEPNMRNLKKIQDDENLIYQYLPDKLQPPLEFTFDMVSPNHPFVLEEIRETVKQAETNLKDVKTIQKDVYIAAVEMMPMYFEEQLKNGFVMDGLQPFPKIVSTLGNSLIPDLIILLKDSSPNPDILTESVSLSVNFSELFAERGLADLCPVGQVTKEFEPIQWDQENLKMEISKYSSTIDEFMTLISKRGVPYYEFEVSLKYKAEVVGNVLDAMFCKYHEGASPVTEADQLNEISDYIDLPSDEEEIEGEGIDLEKKEKEKIFQDNRRLGDTNIYCPVAYALNNLLCKGKEIFSARYLNKLYLCCNQQYHEIFLKDPHKFIFLNIPEKPPPPRICIVGGPKVGKTTLAKALARNLGLHYLNFDKVIKIAPEYDKYIYNEFALPENTLQNILLPYWYHNPMKKTGFVIDGFPKRPTDIDFMINNMAIPELIFEVTCDNYNLTNRLMNALLDQWKIQMDVEKNKAEKENQAELRKWRKLRNQRKVELMKLKKIERYNLQNEEEEEDATKSLLSYKSFDEQEDLAQIELILDQELPEPPLLFEYESYDMAKLRIKTAVEEEISSDPENFNKIRALCRDQLIPWEIIDGSLDIRKVYNLTIRKVLPLKFRNRSFFERVYDISIEVAEKLLESGYYFLSRYGKICPVQIFENENFLPLYTTLESRYQLFPVIHRNYIYFLAGSENRRKFKEDVIKYVFQKNFYFPLIPIRLSVVGPPKCAKTTIAERIQYEYDLKHVSIGKAVRYVLKYLSNSILGQKVESALRVGEELTNELTMKCVEALCFDPKAITVGMVFDGFPNNIYELKELIKVNLVPNLIIDMFADLNYITEYMDVFRPFGKLAYSKKFITYRYREFEDNKSFFQEWTDKEFQNITTLQIKPSKWKHWNDVHELFKSVVFEIKFYYRNRNKDIPLHISNLLITPSEFSQRKSIFRNYCPCCLFHTNSLSCGGDPPDRTGLLQYHNEYYWICQNHIEEFKSDPESFLGLNVRHSLPIILPIRTVLAEQPEHIQSNGVCVVCAYGGQGKRLRVAGKLEFAVNYGDNFYLFDSESCLNTFLRTPQIYVNVKFNFAPTIEPNINLKDLPTLGLLEQFNATQIIKAVIKTNTLRPLIPGLDIKSSAVICIGLYLKINNPKTPKKFANEYKKTWDNLVTIRPTLTAKLMELKRTINPYIHYEEPLPKFELQLKTSLESIKKTSSEEARKIINDIIDTIIFK